MYFLEKKQFKPSVILLSVIFLPIIITIIIAICLTFKKELLLALFTIVLIYSVLIIVFWKISQCKNKYLLLENDRIKVIYPNINNGENRLELSLKQIVKIDYYKITSFKGWFILFSFVVPKCVFITYKKDNNEYTDFIGYMDFDDVKKFANNNDIKLIIH